jgi:hypothetical protein
MLGASINVLKIKVMIIIGMFYSYEPVLSYYDLLCIRAYVKRGFGKCLVPAPSERDNKYTGSRDLEMGPIGCHETSVK